MRISADAAAAIPADARLTVAEVVREPSQEEVGKDPAAYEGRPGETERWASADEWSARQTLAKDALGVTDEDYVFWQKFLRLRVVAPDGREVQPAAPVRVTVETTAVSAGRAAALEAALVDGDDSEALGVTGRGVRVEKIPYEDREIERSWARVELTADRVGEVALAGVVAPARQWELHDEVVSLLAPRGGMDVEVAESDAATEDDRLMPVMAFTASAEPAEGVPDPSGGRGTDLWLRSARVEGATSAGGMAAVLTAADGSTSRLFGAGGGATPQPLPAGARVDLLWDPEWRDASLGSGDVTLSGTLPADAEARVEDRAADFADPGALDGVPAAARGEELSTVAAYDLSLEVGGEAFDPGESHPVEATVANGAVAQAAPSELEVWRVGEDGAAEAIEGDASGGAVSFDATEPATYVVVRREVLERYATASDGSTYEVTVAYGPGSGVPAGAELVVRELSPAERMGYAADAARALGEPPAAVAVGRAFDICLARDGREYHDLGEDVEVSVRLVGEAPAEGARVVHVAGGAPEALPTSVDGDTLTFPTDGFSVFVVAEVVRERVLEASDGRRYRVTVSYDTASGVPASAELSVSELAADGGEGAGYVERAAEALGRQPGQLAVARAFDIALVDPVTGEHYQPTKPVSVDIQLLEDEIEETDKVHVVHFSGDHDQSSEGGITIANDAIEVLDARVDDGTVRFDTTGFSIYVVASDALLQHFVFLNGSDTVADRFSEQVLADGEGLVEAPSATTPGAVFKHWSLTEGGEAYDFANGQYKNITFDEDAIKAATPSYLNTKHANDEDWIVLNENNVDKENMNEYLTDHPVYLYAVYQTPKTVVTFYNQSGLVVQKVDVYKSAEGAPEGARVGSLDTTDAEYLYTPIQDRENTFLAFQYWTQDKVATTESADAGTLQINASSPASIDLYPVLKEGHYLNFDTNRAAADNVSIANIASQFVENKDQDGETLDDKVNELAGELEGLLKTTHTPSATGYKFEGWFTQAAEGEKVFSPKADGTLSCDRGALKGLVNTYGKFPNNPTLYAHWTANPTANYTIIVWLESVSSNKNATKIEERTYAFAKSVIANATTGSSPSTTYNGVNYANHPTISGVDWTPFKTGSGDVEVVNTTNTIKPDGSTVVNIYYNRKLITMRFLIWNYGYTYTETTGNDGTQYGYVDGQFVQLTREVVGTTYQYASSSYSSWSAPNNSRTRHDDCYIIQENTYAQTTLYSYGYAWYTDYNHYNRYKGTVYQQSGSTSTYTGQRYTKAGSTYTPTDEDRTSSLYGGPDANGFYVALTGTQTTTYRWLYQDKLFTGPRYTRSNNQKNGWHDYKNFTGLYGQTLTSNGYTWPTVYDWYDTGNNSGKASGTRTTFLDAFIPTGSNANGTTMLFYGASAAGGTSTIYFQKQDINKTTGQPANSYTEANRVAASGGNFNISDKYNGYTAYQYSTDGTNWTGVGNKGSNGYYNNGSAVSYTNDLYIRFRLNTSDLTFDQNYPEKPADKVVTDVAYTAPLSVYKPEDPAQEGYDFTGWYYDDKMQRKVEFGSDDTMPAEPLRLYAGWEIKKYPIKVIPDGGELGGRTNRPNNYSTYFNLKYGEKINEYKNVNRDYIYVGEGIGTHAYEEYYAPINPSLPETTENDPRSALYTENPRDESRTKDYVNKVGAYVFLGWYEAVDENGNPIEPTEVDEHGNPTVTGTPIRDQYGYVTSKQPFDFFNAPNRTVTLIGKWQRAGGFYLRYDIKGNATVKNQDGTTSEVEFSDADFNGIQIPVDEEEYVENSHALVKAPLGAPHGYVLDYWYNPQSPSKHYQPNELATLNESLATLESPSGHMIVTLRAHYKSYNPTERQMADYTFLTNVKVENGTASFVKDAYGNPVFQTNPAYEVQRISINEVLTAPITPQAPSGYEFKGWYYDKAGTRRFDEFGRVAHPVYTTLYAVFTKVYEVNYYLTDVETGDPRDIVLATQTYSAEVPPEKLDTRHVNHPIDPDHYIDGWTSNGSDRYAYNRATNVPVTSNLNLYAIIYARQYVKFDSQGGSFVATQEIEHGGKPIRPTEPTRAGYKFVGWLTDNNDQDSIYDFRDPLEEGTDTLYAKWESTLTESCDLTVIWWAETAAGNGQYEYQSTATVTGKLGQVVELSDLNGLLRAARIDEYDNVSHLNGDRFTDREKQFFEVGDSTDARTEIVDGAVFNIRFDRKRYDIKFVTHPAGSTTDLGDVKYGGTNHATEWTVEDVWLGKEIAKIWPVVGRNGTTEASITPSDNVGGRFWTYYAGGDTSAVEHFTYGLLMTITPQFLGCAGSDGVITCYLKKQSQTSEITELRYYLGENEATSLTSRQVGFLMNSLYTDDAGNKYTDVFAVKTITGYDVIEDPAKWVAKDFDGKNGYNIRRDTGAENNRVLGRHNEKTYSGEHEVTHTYTLYTSSKTPTAQNRKYYIMDHLDSTRETKRNGCFVEVQITTGSSKDRNESYSVRRTDDGQDVTGQTIYYVENGADPDRRHTVPGFFSGIYVVISDNTTALSWDGFVNQAISISETTQTETETVNDDETVHYVSFFYKKKTFTIHLYSDSSTQYSPKPTVAAEFEQYVPAALEAANVPVPEAPEGQEFDCWSVSPTASEPYEKNMPANDITLYARFKPIVYTVTTVGVDKNANANDTNDPTNPREADDGKYNATNGQELKELQIDHPTRSGAIFIGWQIETTDKEGNVVKEDITENYVIRGNVEIYPKWSDLDARSVVYDANVPDGLTGHGTTPVDSSKYVVGAKVVIMDGVGKKQVAGSDTPNDPDDDRYEDDPLYVVRKDITDKDYKANFAYWNTKADGSGQSYYPSNPYVFYADTVDEDGNQLKTLYLYAIYSEYRETELTYDKNADNAKFVLQGTEDQDAPTDYNNDLSEDGTVKVLFRDNMNAGLTESIKHKPNDPFLIGDDQDVKENEGKVPNPSKFTVIRRDTTNDNAYVFAGWADTKDASLAFAQNGDTAYVNTIDEDTKNTLYAVWGICKIETSEVDRWGTTRHYERVFATIQDAVDYANSANNTDAQGNDVISTENGKKKATIQMLVDYHLPEAEAVTIPEGCDITLTTAKSGTYRYKGSGNATITRRYNGDSLFKSSGAFTVKDITLDGDKGNYASTGNGGLVNVVAGTLNIEDGATLRNSRSTATSENPGEKKGGGAVYSANEQHPTTITMSGGVIEGCESAMKGGGIYQNWGSLTITGGIVRNCSATKEGGGVKVDTGTLEISGMETQIYGCSANKGGGINLYLPTSATISQCSIGLEPGINDEGETVSYANTAEYGGGVFLHGGGSVTINGGAKVLYNAATGRGGGICLDDWVEAGSNSSATISDSALVKGNTATQGGGVYVGTHGALTLSDGTIEECASTGLGAAIYTAGTTTMSGGAITGCAATADNGGAVNIAEGKSVAFGGNAVVYDNKDAQGNQRNVVLDHNDNTYIRTTSSGLSSDANIGVYVVGEDADPYKSHGKAGMPFGTFKDGSSNNLSAFKNDRHPELFGVTATEAGLTASDELIYWAKPVVVSKTWSDGAEAHANETVWFELYRVTGAGVIAPPAAFQVEMPTVTILRNGQSAGTVPWSETIGWRSNNEHDNDQVVITPTSGFFRWDDGDNSGYYLVYEGGESTFSDWKNGPASQSALQNRVVKYTGNIRHTSEAQNVSGSMQLTGMQKGDLVYDDALVYNGTRKETYVYTTNDVNLPVNEQHPERLYKLGGDFDESGLQTTGYTTQEEAVGRKEMLEGLGFTVQKYDDGADDRGYYKLDAEGSWTMAFYDLPGGVYYAVERDVTGEGGASVFERYTPTYDYRQNDRTVGITNGPSAKARVILRKAGEGGAPLAGAKFDVVTRTSDEQFVKVDGQELKGLESGADGVFWVGELPAGTYYLKETKAPDGYAQNRDKYFYFKVEPVAGTQVATTSDVRGPYDTKAAAITAATAT